MIPALAPSPPFIPDTKLIGMLDQLALKSSLVLCLDAGDASSYTSGQTWADVSGNANHFYRGDGSGSNSNDPTFNGAAGRQSSSEYFTSDGGDAFWNTATHSFPNSWHKNNATVTVAGWLFIPSGSTEATFLLGNIYGGGVDRGACVFLAPSSGKMAYQMANTAGPLQTFSTSVGSYVATNAWQFAAISFSEGSGASFVRVNEAVNLLSSDTFSSPSSSDPTKGMSVWGIPNSSGTGIDTDITVLPDNGSRLNSLMAWNRALSQDEVASLYAASKGKFSL